MTKPRPIDKLAKASAKCTVTGTAYGNCILNNYMSVSRDMCAKEFAEFKKCLQNSTGRKW